MAVTENVIKTVTFRISGTVEGVDAATSKMTQFAGSIEGVTVASAQQEKAVLSVERAYQKLQSRYDQEFRAQQNLAQVQKTLQAAQAQGLVTQERASELMQAAIRSHNTITPAVNAYGNATKGARYELLNLSRQLQDVGVGLASGQALFTVAIQQGTQIADVFQTASASGRNLGREILSMITPFRVAVGVLGLLTAAFAAFEITLINTEKALFNLSERTDTPIEKLRALQQVAVPHLDFAEFTKAIDQFAPAVEQARAGLGSMAELFRRNGQSAGDLVQDLLNVADLIGKARDNQQRFTILQDAGLPATQGMVRFLSLGREQIEQQVKQFVEANKRSNELGKSAEQFNEEWSKAWDNFKRNAQDAANIAATALTKGLKAVADAFNESMVRARVAAGDTETQARRFLALQGIRGGTAPGTRLDTDTANQFYNAMRGAAGESAKIANNTVKTNQESGQLAQREIQRVQTLGTLATLDEVAGAKRRELNELEANQGIALGKRKDTLVEIARIEEQSRRSGAVVGALGEAATAAEEYTAALDRLNVVQTQQLLTQEQYRRGLINIKTGMQDVRAFSSSFANSAVSALTDIATGAKSASEAFKNFGNQVLASLTQMVLKITLFNTLEKQLSLGIGRFLPTPTATPPVTTAAVAHSGGVIGVDTFPRVAAHPALWNDAPHFQSGGLVGGVPVIAHTGEGIFTPGQMRAMGGQVVNVNVENNAPTAVTTEQTRGSNGEMNVKLIIDQVESRMADNMRRGRGPMSAATASRFGLNAARGNSVSG